jgi:hypothetical protein
VLLSIDPGHKVEFERFEELAVGIMRRYGGRLERRICFPSRDDPSARPAAVRSTREGDDTANLTPPCENVSSHGSSVEPDELHLVVFPDRASFDRYRSDPDLHALGGLRSSAIRRTVVWEGVDSTSFGRGSR